MNVDLCFINHGLSRRFNDQNHGVSATGQGINRWVLSAETGFENLCYAI